MIFHLHAENHNELFHTGHKKILDSEGLFVFFKSCTREDSEAAQISKNKHVFIPKIQAMNYDSGPPET